MSFTQTITVEADSAQPLADLLERWHRDEAGVAPGYRGARLLEDQDDRGRYVVEVDFTSREEAERNSARPETASWAEQLKEVANGEPTYDNYEVAFTTN